MRLWRQYVLTERGKFVVAMLVAFSLILLSLVLALVAIARNNSDKQPDGNASGEHGNINGDYNGEDSSNPSVTRLIDFNIDSGVMSIQLPVDLPEALEDNIILLIADLLESPRNTENTTIGVELPQLSDEDMAKLTDTIINAFALLEVETKDITFFIYQIAPDSRDYIVNISFRTR